MGIFTKKTNTSFKRNEAGEVIDVERTENKPLFGKKKSRTPTFDALEKKYYEQHPEETTSYKTKKAGKKLLDAFDTWADNYNKNQKKTRKTTRSTQKQKYVIKGGKAYPIARQRTNKRKTQRPQIKPFTMDDFYDPFDTGNTQKKKKGKKMGFDIFDNSGFW